MMMTPDKLAAIAAEMRKESGDDMPMQLGGIPTIYSDIRRWAEELEKMSKDDPNT